MQLEAYDPAWYLGADAVIDLGHPTIRQFAAMLRVEHSGDVPFAQAAFEYTRDSVRHSCDVPDPRVTVMASDALGDRVGLCFAKAHLLTALLRSEGIPAGLCYQRLADGGSSFVLHGLVAVYLRGSWHRQDPRGNQPGVNAQFSLTNEQLAWPVRRDLGERDNAEVLVSPHPAVVGALTDATDALELCRDGLPSQM